MCLFGGRGKTTSILWVSLAGCVLRVPMALSCAPCSRPSTRLTRCARPLYPLDEGLTAYKGANAPGLWPWVGPAWQVRHRVNGPISGQALCAELVVREDNDDSQEWQLKEAEVAASGRHYCPRRPRYAPMVGWSERGDFSLGCRQTVGHLEEENARCSH